MIYVIIVMGVIFLNPVNHLNNKNHSSDFFTYSLIYEVRSFIGSATIKVCIIRK